MNESLRYVASARYLATIRLHQKIENRSIRDMLGEIGGAGEGVAGITVYLLKARQVSGLRSARVSRWRVFRSALGSIPGFGDEQALVVIECEPSLPLGVGNADTVLQRLAERREFLR